MLASYLAAACAGLPITAGCGTSSEGEHAVESSTVSLEIRLQDDAAAAADGATEGALRSAAARAPGAADAGGPVSAGPAPTKYDEVARILVDITFADTGQPFFVNFELTKLASNVWRGDVPLLPRGQQLRFVARALNAAGAVAFSGETLATLTISNQDVQIPVAPAQNGATFQVPRMFRIVYPTEIIAGQEQQFAFTIQGNAGATIGFQITPLGSTTPAAEFLPASGAVTLTNTVADFIAVYTPPSVTVDTRLDYQVTITSATTQSAVAITTNFTTTIKPRPDGTQIVVGTRPSVLFNPVILSLGANGSEVPGAVELAASVSDDSAPAQLSYQWSFTPNASTPAATFAANGVGNPALLNGYTTDVQGTITLAVADEHNGTTTLNYQITPGQFADAIDHGSVNGLKNIVAGNAHTCVLTGPGRVRCWGDNQFGQLGYGNAISVGDAPTRLPSSAGDVPLPATDPVLQVVAGNNHTCALLQSGLVYCWGLNTSGQLGYNRVDNLGDGEAVTSFGYVTLGDLATKIAAGGDHTCAILTSGAVRCWGAQLVWPARPRQRREHRRQRDRVQRRQPGSRRRRHREGSRARRRAHLRATHHRRGALLGAQHVGPARLRQLDHAR
jgi:hypothetical protein